LQAGGKRLGPDQPPASLRPPPPATAGEHGEHLGAAAVQQEPRLGRMAAAEAREFEEGPAVEFPGGWPPGLLRPTADLAPARAGAGSAGRQPLDAAGGGAAAAGLEQLREAVATAAAAGAGPRLVQRRAAQGASVVVPLGWLLSLVVGLVGGWAAGWMLGWMAALSVCHSSLAH
jgi:hypothetical protein